MRMWLVTTWPRRPPTQVYERAGVGPEDIEVVELHDCFTTNELLSYEALGLSAGRRPPRSSSPTATTPMAAASVTNPSGGLLSKGHPLGATGLAQCCRAGLATAGCMRETARSTDARLALQHNIGLGGAAVVTMYEQVA